MSGVWRLVARTLGLIAVAFGLLLWRMNPSNLGLSSMSLFVTSIQPLALSRPGGLWIVGSCLCVLGVLVCNFCARGTPVGDSRDVDVEVPSKSWLVAFAGVCLVGTGLIVIGEILWKLAGYRIAVAYALVVCSATAICLFAPRARRESLLSICEVIGLSIAVVFFSVVYGYDLNSWKYAFIGDEYTFLVAARKSLGTPLTSIPWLEACGVYCGFPWMTSIFQSVSMMIFGDTNVGWRMATVVLIAGCIPALYIFFRVFVGRFSTVPRLVAALACFLFFSLEPTQVWAKIGKPHGIFLPPILVTLGLLGAAHSTGSAGFYGLAGLALGLGFFFTPVGPSLAVVCVILIQALWSYEMYRDKRAPLWRTFVIPGGLVAFGALLGAAPILVQREYFADLARLNLQMSQAVASQKLFLRSTMQAFFSFASFKTGTHFLFGNVFNLVVAFFVVASFSSISRRTWPALVCGIGVLILFSILVGGVSQYGYPPPSRVHVMGVPFAILAAIGLANVLSMNGRAIRMIVIAVVAFSLPLSWGKVTEITPYAQMVNEEGLAIKAIQETERYPVALLTREKRSVLEDLMIPSYYPDGSVVIVSSAGKMSEVELRAALERFPRDTRLAIPQSMAGMSAAWSEREPAVVHYYPAWIQPKPPQERSLPQRAIVLLLSFTEGPFPS